jgi:adenine deaminase
MNYPGVIAGDRGVLDKLAAFQDGHIDGHAPLVTGRDLNAYLSARIRTDHEATSADEAREKLAKGMTVLIREGSVSKDLHALAEVLDENTASLMAFCTDDRNPLDIGEEGHLDFMIRMLIRLGRPRHAVYRAASFSAATAFGLRDRGLVAPGWRADIVLLSDLDQCRVEQVIVGGRLVDDSRFDAREPVPPVGLDSVKRTPVVANDFRIPARLNRMPVIGVTPGRIITRRIDLDMAADRGEVKADLDQDAIKVAVVARHGRNQNIGRGFVHGFGLKRGAIASSVGHDSHNITVVGVTDADMAAAVNRIIELKGGFVVVSDGKVSAELALPVAGLMSIDPFEIVRENLIALRRAAKDLGCTLPEPFLQVAFLPLPVIPHLKITDRGLFDVDRFALIE